MSYSLELERGYRRLLACYPRSFRRENADEIIGSCWPPPPGISGGSG